MKAVQLRWEVLVDSEGQPRKISRIGMDVIVRTQVYSRSKISLLTVIPGTNQRILNKASHDWP